jgi:arylsulfatase A-like enzyme
MLKRLGMYEESLIILVSDHGEEFAEHKGFEHGRTLYEELVQVPLIIKYPDREMSGKSEPIHVSLTDVLPTILDVAGIDGSNLVLDGRSLRDPQLPRRRLLYAELASDPPAPSLSSVSYRAIAFDDLKCIETLTGFNQFGEPIPRLQTFDLSRDPGEQSPLPASDARARQCQTLLERVIARQSRGPSSVPKPSIGEEERRKLRALGYIQ